MDVFCDNIEINLRQTKKVISMREGRCYEQHDFQVLILSQFAQRRPSTEKETWELQKEYLRLIREIPQMWEEFVRKNQNIYDRFGYLDVVVYDDLTYERKKLKQGRPKEENTLSHRVTVRLDDESYQLLKQYCQTKNITESAAIRELIQTLKWKIW
ncbi:CopG family transcriptional regulator [Geobacillus stearothermophilus]|uniref:CopG family transcriptional regulator n=2 Tax=Geobacillus stearothermophilus TaxID=1422 RepID=UPI002E1B662D|nr:CopG family transcriptional regulator [Geobacillus stearothermophilus]MED3783562.1 CopG family transcriptional regulator [Geobacillus stearothermophilus]